MTGDAKSTAVDFGRAAREARRANPDWSLEGSLGVIDRFARAIAAHTADGYGGLAELYAVAEAHRRLADVIDAMARHLLTHDDYRYAEIGEALGITAQAVAKRYPGASSRRRGAQPGNLR